MSPLERPQIKSLIRSTPKKRPTIATVEKYKGSKASTSKKVSYGKIEARRYSVLPPSHDRQRSPKLSLSNG